MEFIVKEITKLNCYYSAQEMANNINEIRKENNLPLCSEDAVKNVIEFIKIGKEFLKVEQSSSYYCPAQRSQTITFDVKPEHVDLIKFQMPGLLNFIIDELSKNKRIIFNDIENQAVFLESFYHSSKFIEKLEEKYPEKEKASTKKPKL